MANGYYETGTASVANGATAVTGVGTSWASQVRVGDKFTRNGYSVPIAAVNSNTSITLKYGWPGTALAGATYMIEPLPDLTRALEAMEDLFALLSSGNNEALAALDGTGGDKAIMLTGAGAASTFTVTAAARSVLNDASIAAMLATLGVAPKQSDKFDATAGAGLIAGAFGLGGATLVASDADVFNSTDFDDFDVTGFYTTTGVHSNGPLGPGGTHTGQLIVLQRYSTSVFQVWCRTNGDVWTRSQTVGSPSADWVKQNNSKSDGTIQAVAASFSTTNYTRSWDTTSVSDALIGPTIDYTPVSDTSTLVYFLVARTAINQTGTDNDAAGLLSAAYQNGAGTYVIDDANSSRNSGGFNITATGNFTVFDQIPLIGQLSNAQRNASGHYVIRPNFEPVNDVTSGYAVTFTLSGLSWILVEIE